MDENRHTLEILQVQFQTTTISKYHNKESQMIFFWLISPCRHYIYTVHTYLHLKMLFDTEARSKQMLLEKWGW